MAIEGAGPVRSTLDHVVDKLNQMNKDQTALQEEAVLYSQELQDYIQKEGHNMSNAQLQSTNELILALQEGRLEDLEEHREELLRNRADAKRDEQRNDTLKDQFKQLKKQYKLLERAFSDKDGFSFIGLIIRTAIVGFVIGVVQGFIAPYVNALKAVGSGISNVAKQAYVFFKFDKLFNAIRIGFDNFKLRFTEFFKNSRLFQFFKGVDKKSFGSRVFNQLKLTVKDFITFSKNIVNFVRAFGLAFIGLFTGAPLAFQRLAEARLAFSPKGVFFQILGGIVNFIKKPFVAAINYIKGVGNSIALAFANFGNRIAGLFTTSGKSSIFTTALQRLKDIFSKTGPLSQFFNFFRGIQSAFIAVGQAVGRFLWPLLALIGFFKGFKEGYGIEEDTFNNFLRTYVTILKNIFRLLIGEFADFLKQLLGFVLDIFTLGNFDFRKRFKSFSFADFFDNIYDAVLERMLSFFNDIRDKVSDISFAGLIKNLGVFLYATFQKIMAFPKAVAAGAGNALLNLFSPVKAFNEAFQKTMADEDARISAIEEGLYERRDGRVGMGEDGDYIKGLSEEGNMLKMRAMYDDGAPISNQEMLSLMMGGDTVFIQPPEEKSGFSRFLSNINPFD